MATETHVKGLAELQKFMDQLAPKVERNVMRGALRAGANVIAKQARLNVHGVSGELVSTIRVGSRVVGSTVIGKVVAGGKRVGVFTRLGFYAAMVEFGTKAHFISVQDSQKPINKSLSDKRRKLVLASMTTINRMALRIANRFVGPTVFHPGAKPHPFMRPALDGQAQNAVVAAAEYMKKRLATKESLDTSHVTIEGDE